MQRNARMLASVLLALALTSPGTALAQEPGVTLDDGPSSKEYAIPLDAARGQTKSKAPTARVRTTPPPPAATTPPATTPTTATSASSPKRKGAKKKHEKAQAAAPVATTPDPPQSDPARVATPASSSSNTTNAGLVIGGLAFAAVALGGLAGLVLRRRRQPLDEH
jgi:hypothetical protein